MTTKAGMPFRAFVCLSNGFIATKKIPCASAMTIPAMMPPMSCVEDLSEPDPADEAPLTVTHPPALPSKTPAVKHQDARSKPTPTASKLAMAGPTALRMPTVSLPASMAQQTVASAARNGAEIPTVANNSQSREPTGRPVLLPGRWDAWQLRSDRTRQAQSRTSAVPSRTAQRIATCAKLVPKLPASTFQAEKVIVAKSNAPWAVTTRVR
mmetsp:Transcript_109248/g.216983  ORF Transcript_109248/g.216983 Transcript_109248/m.216983 type:complete len:210 (-) Transcript_109248:70-699(-)